MENKRKHLEFIQSVITRMNSNSFTLKGWTITLVSALFALAAKDANLMFVLIAYIPIPVFWALDGFYISQERKYRTLYDQVARVTDDNTISFSMAVTESKSKGQSWLSGVFSITLIPFYSILVATTVLITFLIFKYGL